jgi:hypothetical protein
MPSMRDIFKSEVSLCLKRLPNLLEDQQLLNVTDEEERKDMISINERERSQAQESNKVIASQLST